MTQRPAARRGTTYALALVAALLTVSCTQHSTTARQPTPTVPPTTDPSAAPATTTTGAPTTGAPTTNATTSECTPIPASLAHLGSWPRVQSAVARDLNVEREVRETLAAMTLPEKVGQMTQPEIGAITPAQVHDFHIGSVLNGGGSWPAGDKHAGADDWLALADAYWTASRSSNSATRIPLLWGIDAVHGNNNVFGATLFPHNIGLGATRDTCLMREIGVATARQVRATGQDWVFAPVLATVQDDRWGRTYEGYSEDSRIVRAYGQEIVAGLQGKLGSDGVLATAKHFIGDGGTTGGTDQGITDVSEDTLRNVHAQGYYGALGAGAQTVMSSFSSWTSSSNGVDEGKVHGSRRLLTDILKKKIGFDGFVVSDWNGIGQVPGCTNSSCAQAINAGIDMVMVPNDWQAFIATTIGQATTGQIPMARIDDAVTRILRVKFRSGVMTAPRPSQRTYAGQGDPASTRDLARRAVRESLVLLKNNGSVLPIALGKRVLVVGKGADSMRDQTGGWTLSWQGDDNTNDDFPYGTTILSALEAALGSDRVTFDETGAADLSTYDVVVAVLGETPYAEGKGDITAGLSAAHLHPEDLAVLDRVSGKGKPVVTVYLSGRPLEVDRELNRSDAFVAAWLPGTEGEGVVDVLVAGEQHRNSTDFTGTLSYSWPRAACQTPLNVGQKNYAPLFPVGYGLTYAKAVAVPRVPEQPLRDNC